MKYQLVKPFLFLVSVIVVVSLACLGPSGGDTPAEQPPAEAPPAEPAAATPVPPPTSIPPPTEPPSPVTQRFFTEEFDGDLSKDRKSVV